MEFRIAPPTLETLPVIAHLRNERFDRLCAAQELYLELMVKKGTYHAVMRNDNCAGYAVTGNDAELLEFYLLPELAERVPGMFPLFVKQLSLKSALCLSFDRLLTGACTAFGAGMTDVGYSFRSLRHDIPPLPQPADITARPADPGDVPALLEINDIAFVTDDELRQAVAAGTMTVFHKGTDLIGCGLCQQVLPARPHYDVGLLVNPAYRRQGYGTHIMRCLIDRCRAEDKIPVAGCAAENIASKKTLEKAGFTADYRLYRYTLHD